MRRRHLGILLTVILLGGCGSDPSVTTAPGPTSPVPASGAPSAEANPSDNPEASMSPGQTPSASSESLHTIAELLSEPLPAVTLDDLGAMDPGTWSALQEIEQHVVTYDDQIPMVQANPGLALDGALCAASQSSVPSAERSTIRETHCLLLVAREWLAYASTQVPIYWDRARAAYAFVAATLDARGRAYVDQALQATMPPAGSPPAPTPKPSNLKTGAKLLAERVKPVKVHDFAQVVRDTIATDPAAYVNGYFGLIVGVGRKAVKTPYGREPLPKRYRMESAIAVCAYGVDGAFEARTYSDGKKYDLDMQDGCGQILRDFWNAYQATGAPNAYNGAVLSFRLAIQGAPPCDKLGIMGYGCPNEWVQQFRGL